VFLQRWLSLVSWLASIFQDGGKLKLLEVKILQIHNARPEFVKKYHGY
jgi:hypothetical protein